MFIIWIELSQKLPLLEHDILKKSSSQIHREALLE